MEKSRHMNKVIQKIQGALLSENLWRYLLLLVAVVPLLVFRDFTRNNELRYLVIADEAIRDGHVFAFFNQGVPYADKPPLYLWIIMLGKLIFGGHYMAFLGLFSVIPSLVVLWVMNRWVRPVMNASNRLSGQLMLFTCGFFFVCTMMVRMDMLMCMFIVLALHTFYRIYSGEDPEHLKRNRILFPVWIFLAVFTKGPMGLVVPLVSTLTFLIVKKEWRKIGYYWGWITWGILFLLCGLWFTAVYLEGGKEYLYNLTVNQTASRTTGANNHHLEPIWFYASRIWDNLAPWSLFIFGILAWGLVKWRKTVTTDMERFFISIFTSTFILLSLVSSKIEIYLLPAFPFFLYTALLWVDKTGVKRWMKWLVGIPAGVLVLAFPALFVLAHKLLPDLLNTVLVPLSVGILSASAVGCLIWLWRGKFNRAVNALAFGILATVFIGAFALPRFNRYIGMGDIARAAKKEATVRGIRHYYSYGISRGQNMEAYLGTDVQANELTDGFPDMQSPAILFSRERLTEGGKMADDALISAIRGKELHWFGDWFYVVIE